MRRIILSACLLCLTASTLSAAEKTIPNRLINYDQFLRDARTVATLRTERRITEDEFLRMARDPATIILDARSTEKYRQLHIKGAKHLSLPDITAAELARIIPNKSTRILIYCNNNFDNEPIAFPTKAPAASLNIYTFNTLYSYGYENVYELGPVINTTQSKLPFEGEISP
jgi:3-mercaptopyruvate sulfurtransferase SseA